MARPAKQKTPPADRPLTVTLHDYMGRQNELANNIRQYQGLATTLLSYVSQQVGMASQAIGVLQASTLSSLEQNGVDPMDEGLQAFPYIADLLRMNKTDLSNPFAGTFGNALNHMDLSKIAKQAKKQKKPRKPKDPNAPQRPQTAFFLYQMANREKFRQEMQAANPEVKPGDVQKRLTDTWNAMTIEQQKPYKDKYAIENDKYNQAKAEYEKATGKNLADTDMKFPVDPTTGGAEVADASGDAESSEEESSSEDSSSESEPTPPPKKSKKSKSSKKHSSSKEDSPEKKKRKHGRDAESSDDEEPEPKKKSKKSKEEKSGKKKKSQSLIDPELTRQDKEQRKQKHPQNPEYAPAQPTFNPGMQGHMGHPGQHGGRMAPQAEMGMGSMANALQGHMSGIGGMPNFFGSQR